MFLFLSIYSHFVTENGEMVKEIQMMLKKKKSSAHKKKDQEREKKKKCNNFERVQLILCFTWKRTVQVEGNA